MFGRTLQLQMFHKQEYYFPEEVREPTEAEKKRSRFGSMFTLHALMNRAGIKHENDMTLKCSGYIKTKERF